MWGHGKVCPNAAPEGTLATRVAGLVNENWQIREMAAVSADQGSGSERRPARCPPSKQTGTIPTRMGPDGTFSRFWRYPDQRDAYGFGFARLSKRLRIKAVQPVW